MRDVQTLWLLPFSPPGVGHPAESRPSDMVALFILPSFDLTFVNARIVHSKPRYVLLYERMWCMIRAAVMTFAPFLVVPDSK